MGDWRNLIMGKVIAIAATIVAIMILVAISTKVALVVMAIALVAILTMRE